MEEEIYLAGGCFWGIEKYIRQIRGITFTEVGYANGHTSQPTYQSVCTNETGFAETVHIKYDPQTLRLEKLLLTFLQAIDPTSLNKQGEDEGTQYRTGIFYMDENSGKIAQQILHEQEKHYDSSFVVEVLPLQNFYPAEEYHQKYLDKNPTGYCHISPALMNIAKAANDV